VTLLLPLGAGAWLLLLLLLLLPLLSQLLLLPCS
jgi:hypothetical protein